MADLRTTTTSGSDTIVAEATVQAFKTSMRGPLLRPGDVGYDEARQVFNAVHDKHPALIIRCAGVAITSAPDQLSRRRCLYPAP